MRLTLIYSKFEVRPKPGRTISQRAGRRRRRRTTTTKSASTKMAISDASNVRLKALSLTKNRADRFTNA